jgi:hypothetical protein
MKRWLAIVLVLAIPSALVRADVNVVQTTTMEGGLAAMGGANMSPKLTTRVKGMKSRTDFELPNTSLSVITDLVAKQTIVLRHDQKTAQISGPDAAPPAASAQSTVKLDSAATPTGKSQVIDGIKCDEYTFTATMALSDVTGSQVPPETAEMLKGFTLAMKGSTWVSKDVPGAAEFIAYQKALAGSDMAASVMKVSGVNIPGMDRMMKAIAGVDGMAYMTVMDLTIEGGSGDMANMLRQMGTMKVTTRVTSINADPVGDDLFKVPEGYTLVK